MSTPGDLQSLHAQVCSPSLLSSWLSLEKRVMEVCCLTQQHCGLAAEQPRMCCATQHNCTLVVLAQSDQIRIDGMDVMLLRHHYEQLLLVHAQPHDLPGKLLAAIRQRRQSRCLLVH